VRYYVAYNGKVAGPFELCLIEAMVLSKSFPGNILICQDGKVEWTAFRSVSGVETQGLGCPPQSLNRPARNLKMESGLLLVGAIAAIFGLGAVAKAIFNPTDSRSDARSSAEYGVNPTPVQSPLAEATPQPEVTPQPPAPQPVPSSTVYSGFGEKTYRIPYGYDSELNSKRARLDAEEASINSLKVEVDSLRNRIERERLTLDDTNQHAVDRFNQEVHRYNSLNQQLRNRIDAFNVSVDEYNDELARIGTPIN
jgi:hypothetical protein